MLKLITLFSLSTILDKEIQIKKHLRISLLGVTSNLFLTICRCHDMFIVSVKKNSLLLRLETAVYQRCYLHTFKTFLHCISAAVFLIYGILEL